MRPCIGAHLFYPSESLHLTPQHVLQARSQDMPCATRVRRCREMLNCERLFFRLSEIKKNYVRPNSKYKAGISKYVRHIFDSLQTRSGKGFCAIVKCGQKQSAVKNTSGNPPRHGARCASRNCETALHHGQLRAVYLAVHVEREHVGHSRHKVDYRHYSPVQRWSVNLILRRYPAQQQLAILLFRR